MTIRETGRNAEDFPPSYCQKVGRSVKLAVYDTVAGTVAGATLAAHYGACQAYFYYLDAQKAHRIVMDMQAKVNNETSTFDDEYTLNFHSQVMDLANHSIAPALINPVVVGAVIGGSFGAGLGMLKIFRTILFPLTERLV